VIVLAPLAFGAFSGATDPRLAAFYRTPAGTSIVLAGLALDGLGGLWMARLCRGVG
jgi:Flp pilus assembly protein TadB